MSALARGELTRKQAEKQIADILDRVPDEQLAKPDRVEHRDDDTDIAWFGGMGWTIQPITMHDTARNRRFDTIDLFQREWLRRERRRRYGKGFEFHDRKQIGGAA